MEPGEPNLYRDWLRAGRPRCRSSSPGRVKNLLFSMSSRPALGRTQPPTKWALGDSFILVYKESVSADEHNIANNALLSVFVSKPEM
jgi:hypothetical protein